jgi:GDPmannose 4,6-dehydratase
MKKALITGITGQDGAYLAQFLLGKGYTVFGLQSSHSATTSWRLTDLGIAQEIQWVIGNLTDFSSLLRAIQRVEPDEIYNLGAQTSIQHSFHQPTGTLQTNGLGPLHLLEIIRSIRPETRFFQASSNGMFGNCTLPLQDETTPHAPNNPYTASKSVAHWITAMYRNTHQIFACSGILFNHESPLRDPTSLSRKITRAVARIKMKQQKKLCLGNLDIQRDWGYAKDVVEAIWHILTAQTPDDFVIATGKIHSIRDFCRIAFESVGLDYQNHVISNPELFQKNEIISCCGNPNKIRTLLGWEAKTDFRELISCMVEYELKMIRERDQ